MPNSKFTNTNCKKVILFATDNTENTDRKQGIREEPLFEKFGFLFTDNPCISVLSVAKKDVVYSNCKFLISFRHG